MGIGRWNNPGDRHRDANSSVSDFLPNAFHQALSRYAVKVALQIRIDYPVISALKQFIDSAQRILTAFARSELIALGCKVALKDRFHYMEQCSLNDSISKSWDRPFKLHS